MCPPAVSRLTVAGVAQVANAAVSSRHWNVPASLELNLNVSVLDTWSAPCPGPEAGSSVAVGATVSTVNEVDLGVRLGSPLWMPLTTMLCKPFASVGGVNGDVQSTAAPPSTLQRNTVPATVLENVIGGFALLVNAGGALSIVTGTISTNLACALHARLLSLTSPWHVFPLGSGQVPPQPVNCHPAKGVAVTLTRPNCVELPVAVCCAHGVEVVLFGSLPGGTSVTHENAVGAPPRSTF